MNLSVEDRTEFRKSGMEPKIVPDLIPVLLAVTTYSTFYCTVDEKD